MDVRRYPLIVVTLLSIIVLLISVIANIAPTFASGGPVTKNGYVFTRGLVRGPNGQPLYAEFNEQGVATPISGLPNNGEATGELSDAIVMSGDVYRAIVKAFLDFKEAHKEDIARGATVKTKKDYENYQRQTETIKVPQLDGAPTLNVAIPKPDLNKNTQSVYVRNHNTIVDPSLLPTYGAQRGTILFEAPIDLRQGYRDEDMLTDIVSVLINNKGEVVYKSKLNIGFRAAYIKPEDEGIGDPARDNSLSEFRDRRPIKLWGPIAGAKVDGVLARGPTFSADDGKFLLPSLVPPCPSFFWIYNYDISARLRYVTFDPADPQKIRYYPFTGPTYDVCSGFGEGFPGLSLGGLMTKVALMVTDSFLNLSGSFRPVRIFVDVMTFNGDAMLSNDGKAAIQITDKTEYKYTRPTFTPQAPSRLDLDRDRKKDTAQSAGNNLYDVYLGDNKPAGTDALGNTVNAAGEVIQPDLQRLADYKPDFTDQGLLKTITLDDFKNTDLYFYRVSTGKLILEREGIGDNNNVYVIEQDGRFFYRILIPGQKGLRQSWSRYSSIEEAQADVGLADELQGFEADFIRAGEQVKVIAINRATGYIGTTVATIDAKKTANLDFPIDRLILRPPNIKIRAERLYTVTHGQTKDEERKYQIGFEGSGLTTDTYIAIYTDWADYDGSPLPDDEENFKGYEGRLAKVTGANQLGDNAVSFFQIKPGTHTQLVKLKGDILGSEHFYVHVVADPFDADFSETGAGADVLQYRPKRYVPVRVPLLDEDTTRQLRDTAAYQREDKIPNAPATSKDVPAVYRWQYRPEMQFSVFDLKINDLQRIVKDEDGNEVKKSFYAIAPCVTNDPICLEDAEKVNVLYDLFRREFGGQTTLPLLGPQQNLVFALGEDEVEVSYGPDNTTTFNNIAHLHKLKPEEFISLRLYSNTDVENILWEYAFPRPLLSVDLNRDNKIKLDGTDTSTTAKPFRFWINDDRDLVVIRNTPNKSLVRCPSNEEACEQDDVVSNEMDSDDDMINSERDLEDFVLLEARAQPLNDKYTAKIKSVGVNVNVFLAANTTPWYDRLQGFEREQWTSSNLHVTKDSVAEDQLKESLKFTLPFSGNSGWKDLDPKWFDDEGVARFLFEGVTETSTSCITDASNCYLEIAIFDEKNNQIASNKLYMALRSIDKLYQHYTVGDVISTRYDGTLNGNVSDKRTATITEPTPYDSLHDSSLYTSSDPGLSLTDHENEYILFVHGWRMPTKERRAFAETALKRLIWQGYKGRYGFFSWPTSWLFKPAWYNYAESLIALAGDAQNYDRSEAIARRSGVKLSSLLTNLRLQYSEKFNVFAHSMGNIVMSEALKVASGRVIDTYVASQASSTGGAYVSGLDELTFFGAGFERAWRTLNIDRIPDHALDRDIPPNQYEYSIPNPHSMDPNEATAPWGSHYYAGIAAKAGKIINFANGVDAATSTGWVFNQIGKPDENYASEPEWEHDWDCLNNLPFDLFCNDTDRFHRDDYFLTLNGKAQQQINWVETFPGRPEIIAHILPARTFALGVIANIEAKGEILRSINLTGAPYYYTDSGYDHSAQFLSTNIERYPYWRQLMREFGLSEIELSEIEQ